MSGYSQKNTRQHSRAHRSMIRRLWLKSSIYREDGVAAAMMVAARGAVVIAAN